MEMIILDEMQALVEKLNAASEKYYNCGDSDISDAEWDRGYNYLLKLESKFGGHFKNSPTHTVGFVSKESGDFIYE